MLLEVQKFLLNHTRKELEDQYGVFMSFDKTGRKASINYDQIAAKESDLLSQQCRGLILAPVDQKFTDGKVDRYNTIIGETIIIAYPMDRFFNVGQGAAIDINWNDPKLQVLSKLDGTLCILHFCPFNNAWKVATRSVCEADLLMENQLYTFSSLFEKALFETTQLTFDQFTLNLNRNFTYCFELTTPLNTIVVRYPDYRVTLLAVRDLSSLQELDLDDQRIDITPLIPRPQTYNLQSLSDTLNWVSSLNPLEYEGVVIKTSKGRVKAKNANYVAYSKLNDRLGTSERNCMELILSGSDDDVASVLPDEILKNLNKLKMGLNFALKMHDQYYQVVKKSADMVLSGDKKTFALLLNNNSKEIWTAPLFQMYSGKVDNMRDFIEKNKKGGTWGDNFLDKMLELSKNNL